MSFLRGLFQRTKLDGEQMALSADMDNYAQIALLSEFTTARPLHDGIYQQRWTRTLPRPYADTVELFVKLGWLETNGSQHQVTAAAMPFVRTYEVRLATERSAVLDTVRAALAARDTGEALNLRRAYEARQPLGKADWTGPEPQLSHSALTRRILFLDHWLLNGLSRETIDWLKLHAAEQHLWGAYWRLAPDAIPDNVRQELAAGEMDASETAYWRAYQLALLVDNQETWQRCKGGDHVRRIEIVGPDDEFTCNHCRTFLGQQYLVARVLELPHRECSSARGCRCRYEPVLESYEELG